MGDVTHRLRTTTRTYSELVLLRESPVHGLTDCIVPFRIECMPHVVSEHNVTARIRTELPLESPTDWNECVPSPVHHGERTCDSISQSLRWIRRLPS